MNSYKKKFLAMLGLIILVMSHLTIASEVQDSLARWREHILTNGNMAGVELHSEDYDALVRMGPNALPEVFSALSNEDDIHVLYYYEILIARLAHFDFYVYSQKPLNILGHELYDPNDKPSLSVEYGDNGLPVKGTPELTIEQKYKLIQWWNQRASFTKRKDADAKIRSVTGKTRSDHLGFNKAKARNFFKMRVYGIYNIPYYIDLIDQDNNPFVFCEFLRISNHPEFQAFDMTSDLVSNGFKVEEKYPTRESKISLICEWWSQQKNTYKQLQDLYSSIDSQIEKLCNQSATNDPNATS